MTTTTQTAAPAVIFAEAQAAAQAAFEAAAPTPMVVQNNQTGERWYVGDGVCGFAYVNIRPARGPMVAWLKKQNIGYRGYYGGYQMSSGNFAGRSSQSMQRAEAAAKAASEVFRSYGINSSWESRID